MPRPIASSGSPASIAARMSANSLASRAWVQLARWVQLASPVLLPGTAGPGVDVGSVGEHHSVEP